MRVADVMTVDVTTTIEAEARDRLAYQRALAGDTSTVLVKVLDGDATLTGVVGTQDEVETLEGVVREIAGVVHVRSDFSVRPGA